MSLPKVRSTSFPWSRDAASPPAPAPSGSLLSAELRSFPSGRRPFRRSSSSPLLATTLKGTCPVVAGTVRPLSDLAFLAGKSLFVTLRRRTSPNGRVLPGPGTHIYMSPSPGQVETFIPPSRFNDSSVTKGVVFSPLPKRIAHGERCRTPLP